MLAFLGLLSGLILIAGDVPYALNALKGRTRPHRISWLVIFVLNLITIANQIAIGATSSLGLVIGSTIATGAIFTISIRRGVGGFAPLDLTVLAGSVIGLLLWWRLNSPLTSIVVNVLVSTLAIIPTYKKAYLDPASETAITWLVGSIAAFLALLSIGQISTPLIIVPLYSFVAQAGLYAVMLGRRYAT
jgi:hypothetical protein